VQGSDSTRMKKSAVLSLHFDSPFLWVLRASGPRVCPVFRGQRKVGGHKHCRGLHHSRGVVYVIDCGFVKQKFYNAVCHPRVEQYNGTRTYVLC